MKKTIIKSSIILLSFIVLLVSCSQDSGITPSEHAYLKYEIVGEVVHATVKANTTDIVIPSTVTLSDQTYSVVFKGFESGVDKTIVKTFTIDVNVVAIEPTALTDCTNLSSISIPEARKSLLTSLVLLDNTSITIQGNNYKSYLVSFKSIDNINLKTQFIKEGTQVSTPTLEGYGNISWVKKDNTPYDFNQPVVKNMVLHTSVEAKTYTVTYNANGSTSGTAPDAQTKIYDAPLSLAGKGNLAKENHNFTQWNTSANGTGTPYGTGAIYADNESITLYAQWAPIASPLSLNPGSATATNGVVYTYTPVTSTNPPVQAGYTFAGFYSGDGVKVDINEISQGQNIGTLWIPNVEMIPVLSYSTEFIGDQEAGSFKKGITVSLSPFEISKYEVTQQLFQQVMGFNPSLHQGTDYPPYAKEVQELRPVENFTLYDAFEFCNKLTELTMSKDDCAYTITDTVRNNSKSITSATVSYDKSKMGYRLPTNAEWECAARGGNQTNTTNWNYPYSGGNTASEVAWFHSDMFNTPKTHQVGLKKANSLGLHDMSGNVCEWCLDFGYFPNDRGGSYDNSPSVQKMDGNLNPFLPNKTRGLRVCRSLTPSLQIIVTPIH